MCAHATGDPARRDAQCRRSVPAVPAQGPYWRQLKTQWPLPRSCTKWAVPGVRAGPGVRPRRAITAAKKKLNDTTAARDQIPVKLRADQIDPDAEVAVLRAGRRGLQMVLRLLAHNAEHWLATHLNAYLRDDDEHRAVTRQTIIRGLAGTITYTPAAITVTLEPPGDPRVARALTLLTGEINTQPPSIPGDTRPITYRITPQPAT